MIQLRSYADDELIKLYEAGEDEAFDVLLARYEDRLYTYILFIVKNSDIADDLFQETFVRVIMTIRQHRYKATGKFYAWLTRIAHNLIIDQFRTERSEGLVYDEEQSNNIFNNAHLSDASIEHQLDNEQTFTDVCRLMNHLPDTQREVVYMRYYQNLSFKEIADQIGVSINTALGRMRYAVLNMRKMAKDYDINLSIS